MKQYDINGNGHVAVKDTNGKFLGSFNSATLTPASVASVEANEGTWATEYRRWVGIDWECPSCDQPAAPFEDLGICAGCAFAADIDNDDEPYFEEMICRNCEDPYRREYGEPRWMDDELCETCAYYHPDNDADRHWDSRD